MKSKIFLIGGKKGAGKNHVSDILIEYLKSKGHTVDVTAFADPMKDIISKSFGISLDEIEYMKNANDSAPITITCEDRIVHTNMRELLQKFGTEAMQGVFGVKVWRNLCVEYIEQSDCEYVIVTDYRFPNEVIDDSLKVYIYNEEKGKIVDAHISENLLTEEDFDYTLDNSGKPSKDDINKLISDLNIF